MIKLNLPIDKEQIKKLHAGDSVLISGTIYTARDCAHKRLKELLESGEKLPFNMDGAFIYYAGPCPAKPGYASGSCGPTTSARMDAYAPLLLDNGLGGMIGKGEMSEETRQAIIKHKRIYFAAIGGAGAVYGNAVQKSELVAFPDLLSEAVYKLTVKDFPLVVAIDSSGNSIYKK